MTRPVLGLLHTSPVHVATFDALAAEDAIGVEVRHLVREDLLDRTRTQGPDAVADDVAAAIAALDADVVLCTCSTIGAVAERVGAGRALRIDRPMAAVAVRGGPVVVLAALESTVAPTLDLLAQEASRAGVAPQVTARVVPGAWDRFEAGDLDDYHARVARAIEDAAGGAAAIVLAQASMAPAAELARVGVPVITSPRLGLRAAIALLR